MRVITATNRELLDQIRPGAFREDLYYRLNVIHIRVPPLRERVEDIPLLADFFLQRAARTARRRCRFAPDVYAAMQAW